MNKAGGIIPIRCVGLLLLEDLKRDVRSPLFWFLLSFVVYCVAVWFTLVVPIDEPAAKYFLLLSEFRTFLGGVLASFLLFYLISYLPDKRRRSSLRLACQRMYRSTKEGILWDVLHGSWNGGRTDIVLSSATVKALLSPKEFRKYFENGSEADEGFYAFTNYVMRNEDAFRSVIFKFKLVARQLEFLLNNLVIEDQDCLETLKRLEQWLLSLDELHAGYDEVKRLDAAIWAIFTGWSTIEGYRGYDPIERAIARI